MRKPRGRPRTKPIERDTTMRWIAKLDLYRAVALQCGVTPSAVRSWTRVPSHHVIRVEQALGRPRHLIRPDLFQPE